MTSHRKVPKPGCYSNPQKGQCRWCGESIFKLDGVTLNNRANWHPKCVKEYKLVAWPAVTRKAVYKRDKGICAACGHQCPRSGKGVWHLDHIKPLIESQGNLDFWKMPNLQTLCIKCHTEKTSKENSERARQKRKQKAALQNNELPKPDQK